MPPRESKVGIVLEAQDRATRQIKNVQSSLDGMKGRLQSMQPTFQRMAVAGTAAFSAIAFGATKAIQEASRVQEVQRLFEATFKETRTQVSGWAADISEKFGRAEHDMLQVASTAGSVLAAAFEIPEKRIADLTTSMGEAALALAATDPRIENTQQAMEGFTQALIGNRQRVIDWGFQVRDEQLKVEALERGIIGVNEKLNAQQKAMLTAQLITEQVSVSTEVLNQSQEDWSQISKRLQGQVKELSASLGKTMLPIVEDIGMALVPIIKDVAAWVEENPALAKTIVIAAGAIAGLVAVLGTAGLILPSVITGVQLLSTALLSLAANPVGLVIAAVVGLSIVLKEIVEAITGVEITWGDVFSNMLDMIQPVVDAVKDLFNWISEVNQILTNGKGLSGFIENVIGGAGELGKSIGDFFSVDDAIITPRGDIVKPAKDDFVVATKDPSSMGGGGTTFNFDFRNATITDKEEFMRDIEKSMSRGLSLKSQGIS